MNARERTRFDMIERAEDFGLASAAQTKAEAFFAALDTVSTGLIARINANATAQESGTGDFHGGTTSQSVLHDVLLLELRGINRSAAAIAEEDNNPGLTDSFRMPYSVGDVTLAARARAFIAAATPLAAQFEVLGQDATFLTDLETHIETFENADTEQNEGEEAQAEAKAGFGPLIGGALGKVRSLDAIMHNLYKANAVKLAAWRTASHTKWQPTKAKQTPTLPTPPTR